jgi:predicted alpha/beta-hydrolase family hydrolase
MFLHDEAISPRARLVLAHGAGAPMDHDWMNGITALLTARSINVTRFEFAFMAGRRSGGKRRPAPRGDKLVPEYIDAVSTLLDEANDNLPLFIGGKSLGGRVASLAADELFDSKVIRGVVCLGYPFHPPKKPENLRTAHLEEFACPALIIQGTRDPLGSRDEVETYDLDRRIKLQWCEDGDHDLKPRKKSGFSQSDHMTAAAEGIARFISSRC